MKALHTGKMEAMSEDMICRNDCRRPKSRITRKARIKRRVFRGPEEPPGEKYDTMETVTTRRSKQENPSLKKGQKKFAARFQTSSKKKIHVKKSSKYPNTVASNVPSSGSNSDWAVLAIKLLKMNINSESQPILACTCVGA